VGHAQSSVTVRFAKKRSSALAKLGIGSLFLHFPALIYTFWLCSLVTEFHAWPTSDIGRFRVQLPAGTVAEINLRYDASRPFPRLEGVQVMGRAGDTVPGVRSDGVDRIRFMAGDAPLDMTVIVIDYYR